MKINIHNIIDETRVEGPGIRTALWVQGCSIRCEGCMIPDTWNFSDRTVYNVDDLVAQIITNENIEGITILGGEPFDQIEALFYLITEIRNKSSLSIMLFSGYTSEYLKKTCPHFDKIMSEIDIFIEGPYIKNETDFSREWVGSANQQIHFLTERYLHLKDEVYKDSNKHNVEIRLEKDGSLNVNGMLPKEKLEELIKSFSFPESSGFDIV